MNNIIDLVLTPTEKIMKDKLNIYNQKRRNR